MVPVYEGVSKSFRTGHLERELQTVNLSATRCSCIATLRVSLVSFAAINLCVASQLVFMVVKLMKLLDTPSHVEESWEPNHSLRNRLRKKKILAQMPGLLRGMTGGPILLKPHTPLINLQQSYELR